MSIPLKDWPLTWWDSGERQVVEEKLDDLERTGTICNPKRSLLYKALSATPLRETRVAIIGQDPYPTSSHATGLAFSCPRGLLREHFPATLKIILGELQSDLHYDLPDHGDLHRWTSQGVLLWNAIPSCQSGKPLSNDWEEWSYLTREIVQRLSDKGVVFAFLGGVAGRYAGEVDTRKSKTIRVSHPSPRGNKFGKTPFTGSRIFSTINAKLCEMGQTQIDWRLTNDSCKGDVQRTSLGRSSSLGEIKNSRVLPNILGANLGGLKKQGTSPNIYTSLEF